MSIDGDSCCFEIKFYFLLLFAENLEALERGELKFSCSYYEGDNFGDSCGSAESEEGSDSEVEENKYQLITEVKENGEISDVDVEVMFLNCAF